MAAREGMIAMITADSGRSAKAVAPFGGAKARLGTNPICFAVPSNLEGPLVFDMATSAAAAGKINVATARGEQVPAGWLIDAEGKPSTDPRVLTPGRRAAAAGRLRGIQGLRPGSDRGDPVRAVDRPGLWRRADRAAQRRLLHRRVQCRRIPRPCHVQAGGDGVRAVPEGDAAGAGLHRSVLSGRDRIQAGAGSAQERHADGGRHLEASCRNWRRATAWPTSWVYSALGIRSCRLLANRWRLEDARLPDRTRPVRRGCRRCRARPGCTWCARPTRTQ